MAAMTVTEVRVASGALVNSGGAETGLPVSLNAAARQLRSPTARYKLQEVDTQHLNKNKPQTFVSRFANVGVSVRSRESREVDGKPARTSSGF